jgi:hypothetical protein
MSQYLILTWFRVPEGSGVPADLETRVVSYIAGPHRFCRYCIAVPSHSFGSFFASSPTFLISLPLYNIYIMAPSQRGWQMIEIVSVLVSLSLISVVLRMFARLRRRVGFGIDDYLSVVSIVLLIAMLIELILCE